MSTVDLQRFLGESTLTLEVLEQWIERRWIVTTRTTTRIELSDADAARALFIRDLRSDFGVNDEGVDLVLHLVDQVHGLRRALAELRGEFDTTPDRGPAPE